MRLQRFPAGVKPLESDLNSLSDNALNGIQDLISIFTADPSGAVLFEQIPPIVDPVADDVLTVRAPAQTVSIGGAVEVSADYFESFDVSTLNRYVEIFYVISRSPVTATRNFLSLDTTSGSTILQNMEAEIAEVTNVRTVFLTQPEQPTNGANSLSLALNSNDLGLARLGSVFYDRNSNQSTFTPDLSYAFTFPSDPTVQQDPDPTVSQSQSGYMTPGLLELTLSAVQNVYIAQNAEAIISSSRVGNDITLDFSYGPGLTATNSGLQPNFLSPSAEAGVTERVARADHVHALFQSGIIRVDKYIQLSTTSIGQLTDIDITAADLPPDATLSDILSVEVYWAPQLNFLNRIALSWLELPSSGGTLGARAYINSTSSISVEIGSAGALRLGPNGLSRVAAWVPNSSVPDIPNTGYIYINILGLRNGA